MTETVCSNRWREIQRIQHTLNTITVKTNIYSQTRNGVGSSDNFKLTTPHRWSTNRVALSLILLKKKKTVTKHLYS